jgi:hypothetical protein
MLIVAARPMQQLLTLNSADSVCQHALLYKHAAYCCRTLDVTDFSAHHELLQELLLHMVSVLWMVAQLWQIGSAGGVFMPAHDICLPLVCKVCNFWQFGSNHVMDCVTFKANNVAFVTRTWVFQPSDFLPGGLHDVCSSGSLWRYCTAATAC